MLTGLVIDEENALFYNDHMTRMIKGAVSEFGNKTFDARVMGY